MNKDAQLFKMVENEIKRRYESAQQQEIKQILSKKPKSTTIFKKQEIRPFDEIKRELETKIEQQNFALKKKEEQCLRIERISFKMTKAIKELQIRSDDVIEREKLMSGENIKKSLRCLKNRDELNIDLAQPSGNLIQQNQSVKLSNEFKNNQLKLFLKDSEIMVLNPEFEKRHRVEFNNSMLDQNDLEKRAEILAKLSLVEIFQSQVPVLEEKQRLEDVKRKEMSEMESMKQEAEAEKKRLEKAYETQSIPEAELISQAKEILRLLELGINQAVKKAFENKNYDEAVKYKKELETLRKEVDSKILGVDKLKYLIMYKCKKGF